MHSPSHGSHVASHIEGIATVEAEFFPAADTCASLLEKLSLLESVVGTISEIHPYAKMAFNVIEGVYKIVVQQMERDQNVKNLLSVMNSTFDFVTQTDALREKAQAQKDVITLMVQQTTECGHFLKKYAGDRNFVMRLTKNLLSTVDTTINSYITTFKELSAAFSDHAVLQTQIKVIQIMTDLTAVETKLNLSSMPYAVGARFQEEKTCLLGTRQEILDEISQWINNAEPDGPRVYLLMGAAGAGKSAIAHTIAHRIAKTRRLASSFCFDRNDPSRTPDKLFCTLARDLGDYDKSGRFTAGLAQLETSVQTTKSATEQFQRFFIEICKTIDFVGPILFVIDALDESAKSEARRVLLELLSRKTQALPPNFRFIVTSRAENDIIAAFEKNNNVKVKRMEDILRVEGDIFLYIKSQLSDLHGQLLNGIDERMCKALSHRAEGLFQWAYVACATINPRGKGGSSPRTRYDRLMSTDTTGLDGLYRQILSDTFDLNDTDMTCRVLGLVLTSNESLSKASLQELYETGYLSDRGEIVQVLDYMGSLMTGVAKSHTHVRPLHTSFRDFLTDPQRSGRFYIDIHRHNSSLCLASLNVMAAGLRFNICGLETSYLRNRDVMDIDNRVSAAISPALSYACRFWGMHLQQSSYDLSIHKSLERFIHTLLLYWFEALSLLKKVNVARESLLSATRWSRRDDPDLAEISKDGAHFVNLFAPALAESAPHTYLSALPFTPRCSLLNTYYRHVLHQTLSFRQEHVFRWPALQTVLHGHESFIISLAFSPDCKHIASGSGDNTIRIWDVLTGETVSGPYVGHEDKILSVVFSPDGKRVASGSRDTTIRVWNVQTGETVSGPYVGHGGEILSVIFSPHGKRVASGSSDGTIRVWDIETGQTISGLYVGHQESIRCVIFSSDGKHIKSGSTGGTIRVWDVETGETVWSRSIESKGSFAFSPDGKRMASKSNDSTIRLWDVETGETVSGPYVGHTGPILSMALSQDGKRIVSGSLDKTVRLWDVKTGENVSRLDAPHDSPVLSVAFSPDGKQVASGLGASMICLYDVEIATTVSDPTVGNLKGLITSVAFSSDGKCIVSGDADGTIHVWDVETGKTVAGPWVGHEDSILSFTFSADGQRLASGSADNTIRLWDIKRGETISGPYVVPEEIDEKDSLVIVPPDGMRIALVSTDTRIHLWNLDTNETVSSPHEVGHERALICCAAFSPDGKQVATGSEDKMIRLWNVETATMISDSYIGHKGPILSVAFSPDGMYIVSGSSDSTIRVWDVATGKTISGPYFGHGRGIKSVVFSPDGKRVASGSLDRTVRLWDIETGEMVSDPYVGHDRIVSSIAFSPDGKRITSGSFDYTVRVWDVEADEIVLDEEHTGYIRNSSMKRDGWAVGPEGQLLFWVPPMHHNRISIDPRCTGIMGGGTVLNYKKFVHGCRWDLCRGSDAQVLQDR